MTLQYTVQDEPNVRDRIERDLARVTAAVRDADPALRSLVLTGGFARGEGAVFQGRPQNDYDFIAIRGLGRPRSSYESLRRDLEQELGLHIDLARIAAWRLPWVASTIFWYETALRGRVLWGEDLLHKIPIRTPWALDRAEGLRLLVNRAAGLLLASETHDAHALRIQAAKGLLAAADAHLLAAGEFAPTQVERWERLEQSRRTGTLAPEIERRFDAFAWGFRFKVDPGAAPARDAAQAWTEAADAILEAIPVALRHARLPSLEAYERADGLIDHLIYYRRSKGIEGARRLVRHPTARVRVATLRLLAESRNGHVTQEAARRSLGGLAHVPSAPLPLLDALRRATLQ